MLKTTLERCWIDTTQIHLDCLWFADLGCHFVPFGWIKLTDGWWFMLDGGDLPPPEGGDEKDEEGEALEAAQEHDE